MANIRLHSLLPGAIQSPSRSTKRTITEFAEDAGMVYFGYVSQRDDEHHILRGMTVSTKHHDDHYCIGTHDTYDVVFVERSDKLRNGKKHCWHIMEFDLKTTADIPHAFIGSGKRGHGFHELLEVKYPHLQPIELGISAAYPAEFTANYKIYTTPAHAVGFEILFPPETATVIASHFSGLVLELTEQALYVYSEQTHLTKQLLDTMLKNGAWLASEIDKNSRLL